jgi:hypothetical protein
VRPTFLLLASALALVSCGRDRAPSSSTQSGTTSAGVSGPQPLVLRMARNGGPPRVSMYPRVDSVVWASADPAPSPDELLAFNDDAGSVAYRDSRGRPVMLELRLGTIAIASSRKLTGLASADGRSIFGITADGNVVRMTASGDWNWKPPQPARALYPQPNGNLLVVVGDGANTHLLKINPPDTRVLGEIPFPAASRTARSQLGDRLYVAVDSGIIVLRPRTMDWAPAVPFAEPIVEMAATPSGDRVFVLTEARNRISVIDRYREAVTSRFELPGKAADMRIDAFGRYLLARAADNDSIWVVAIGTERVIGGLRGAWRDDLPFVGYDGSIVVASGPDVFMFDGETLRQTRRVRGGAAEYWFPFSWNGFRPRAASLDEPVRFDSLIVNPDSTDSTAVADTTAPADVDSVSVPVQSGFVVSFAAFLNVDRARELSSRIRVEGENARIVSSDRGGTTIYRVILGPYPSREDAERAGKASGQSYWVYEGVP